MIKYKFIVAVCFLLTSFISANLFGQNVFPQKVEGCNIPVFCLDCGTPKAIYDSLAFTAMLEKINKTYNLNGARGGVLFQVLVDSASNGCVLSHTGPKDNPIINSIIQYLNACKWIAAKENNKAVSSSINVLFSIANGKMSGGIQKVDQVAMNENMKNPGTPTIYNKTYQYKNPSLAGYEVKIWQKENSGFPNDMSIISMVDKTDQVWCATLGGLAKFDGNTFLSINEKNSPFKSDATVSAMAVDKNNNKWFSYNHTIYKFNNTDWEKCDSIKTGIKGAYQIIASDNGEIFFCSDKGLLIYKNGNWNLLDNKSITQLPLNRVYYAYRDKLQRLWIGTFGGTIMIDKDQKVTEYNRPEAPLNEICISGATEDEDGNVYFSLYHYKRSEGRDDPKEGLLKLSKDGTWTHYNDINSGLPADHINSLLYDRVEKILWIGTNEAGLVRFDLKDGWENYHNENSKVPSSYIFAMSQDSKGTVFVSTYYGMISIKKN